MTGDGFWNAGVPLRVPSVLPKWRPLPGKRKPPRLVEPDLNSYDECFRKFRFWEIAPAEEEVLVDRPNLNQEPACEIKELKLVGAETRIRKLACWLVWFSCQPSDRKAHLVRKGRELGGAYLREIDELDALSSDTEPRLPVRSGTMLLGASPEALDAATKHWQQMELRWLAWYAQEGNFQTERCEAIAWNLAIPLFEKYGRAYPQREEIKHMFQERVVESEAIKSELIKLANETGLQPRSLLSQILNPAPEATAKKKAPCPVITNAEFDRKSSEWIGAREVSPRT